MHHIDAAAASMEVADARLGDTSGAQQAVGVPACMQPWARADMAQEQLRLASDACVLPSFPLPTVQASPASWPAACRRCGSSCASCSSRSMPVMRQWRKAGNESGRGRGRGSSSSSSRRKGSTSGSRAAVAAAGREAGGWTVPMAAAWTRLAATAIARAAAETRTRQQQQRRRRQLMGFPAVRRCGSSWARCCSASSS